jgi:uncharacterized membrane protein YjgN (DUF898 family)
MEITTQKTQFYGEGGKYFGIVIVNFILTVITLGLYYPWARAKTLQYLYGETEFAGNRLTFHGTGKEMFMGFIKAVGILFVLYIILVVGIASKNPALILSGVLVFFVGFLLIIPLAIHGGLRYRMSRTSWKGIHFGYRGKLSELLGLYFKGLFLTIITLGIYGPWFSASLERYIADNLRLGNVRFRFDGQGKDLFIIVLKFAFLVYLTLGIYTFWYLRNINHWAINNLKLIQDEQEYSFISTLTPGQIFETSLINLLLVIFTLGIGFPWAVMRQMRLIFDNIELQGAFNADAVIQTEGDYSDATGDDLLSMLDIGLHF